MGSTSVLELGTSFPFFFRFRFHPFSFLVRSPSHFLPSELHPPIPIVLIHCLGCVSEYVRVCVCVCDPDPKSIPPLSVLCEVKTA